MGVEYVEKAFFGTFTTREYLQMVGDDGESEYLGHLCRMVLHSLLCGACVRVLSPCIQ